MSRIYGAPPEPVGKFEPDWSEYMHYLYLPVVMKGSMGVRLPERLSFAADLVRDVMSMEGIDLGRPSDRYVYVTARHGYASPGNPLNRPGWHADGFGSDDVNYIWSNRWPTRYAVGQFTDISTDHVLSSVQFTEQILASRRGPVPGFIQEREGDPYVVYRLDPSVVHATPLIPSPGGNRSFLKVSVSPNKYNLLGNSHNYLYNYVWKMWSRYVVRNDPAWSGGDSGPQEHGKEET